MIVRLDHEGHAAVLGVAGAARDPDDALRGMVAGQENIVVTQTRDDALLVGDMLVSPLGPCRMIA